MARAAILRRLTWHLGRVTGRLDETPRVRTLILAVPGWPGHRAGQHVDVRLTADDGYQAQRSFSIASAPDDRDRVALTIERIEGGEVSPYLVDELAEGDRLELRGPIGGHFVWDVAMGGPHRCDGRRHAANILHGASRGPNRGAATAGLAV
jgi:ferredoxin-NADP reductase